MVTLILVVAFVVAQATKCHKTWETCKSPYSNGCLTCREDNVMRRIHEDSGYCECQVGFRPEPDATNWVRNCNDNCETCMGPGEQDCLTCPESFRLAGDSPNQCINSGCHPSCAQCIGNKEFHCSACGANAELHSGYCICKRGFYLSPDHSCKKPVDTSDYHEFKFDKCGTDWISNGVTLEGRSTEKASASFPQPVVNRGVFFNNKTYFHVSGLQFQSDFSINAWIKSHDLGRSTIFSKNSNLNTQYNDDVTSFSWRVSNRSMSKNQRRDMIELKDWSNEISRFSLQTEDPAYSPKKWSNIGFSVEYEEAESLTTITFYSFKGKDFTIVAITSIDRNFSLQNESTDIIGHRLTRKGKPGNEYFGFIYYISFYTFATDDFSNSIDKNCSQLCDFCAAGGTCLEKCWISEYEEEEKCYNCNRSCMACLDDGLTCYCPHLYP